MPELIVAREAAVEVTHTGTRLAYSTTRQGLHVLIRGEVDGEVRYWLEVQSAGGTENERDLPALTGRLVHGSLGVDADHVALLVHRESATYNLLRLDQRTGAETWLSVTSELDGLADPSPSALIGDELVVATGVGVPGRLYALSTLDGQVRSIELPAPEQPDLLAVPSYFWPDPLQPGSLIVSYHVQHFEQVSPDLATIVVFDRFLARLDVRKGTWTMLHQAGPWTFEPLLRPLGVPTTARSSSGLRLGPRVRCSEPSTARLVNCVPRAPGVWAPRAPLLRHRGRGLCRCSDPNGYGVVDGFSRGTLNPRRNLSGRMQLRCFVALATLREGSYRSSL